MHIQFWGKLSAIRANLVLGEGSLTIQSKMEEMDTDTIDRLAEFCEMDVAGYARVENEKRPAVSIPCRIESVKGNFATKIFSVTLKFHKGQLAGESESHLVEICRLGWEVSVEISNQQLTLPGLEKLRDAGLTSVTLEGAGRKVELK